jgi:hypothetical protein
VTVHTADGQVATVNRSAGQQGFTFSQSSGGEGAYFGSGGGQNQVAIAQRVLFPDATATGAPVDVMVQGRAFGVTTGLPGGMGGGFVNGFPFGLELSEQDREFEHACREAAQAIVEAKQAGDDPSERQAELKRLIAEHFEYRQQQRRKEIDALKQKLEEIEATFAKRQDRAEQIIDRRLNDLLNQPNLDDFYGDRTPGAVSALDRFPGGFLPSGLVPPNEGMPAGGMIQDPGAVAGMPGMPGRYSYGTRVAEPGLPLPPPSPVPPPGYAERTRFEFAPQDANLEFVPDGAGGVRELEARTLAERYRAARGGAVEQGLRNAAILAEARIRQAEIRRELSQRMTDIARRKYEIARGRYDQGTASETESLSMEAEYRKAEAEARSLSAEIEGLKAELDSLRAVAASQAERQSAEGEAAAEEAEEAVEAAAEEAEEAVEAAPGEAEEAAAEVVDF